MKRALYTLLLFTVLALALPAQEHESGKSREAAGEKEEHGEMMGWKWANFALLALGLGYFLVKNLPPFFSTRSNEIRQGIDEAAKLKAAAEAQARDIDARLNAIGTDIAKLRDQLKSELAAEGARLKAETERSLARIEDQAQQELAFMSKASRQELKAFSAELAVDLAKGHIQDRMNTGVQQRLVDTFIHDLKTAEHGTSIQ